MIRLTSWKSLTHFPPSRVKAHADRFPICGPSRKPLFERSFFSLANKTLMNVQYRGKIRTVQAKRPLYPFYFKGGARTDKPVAMLKGLDDDSHVE